MSDMTRARLLGERTFIALSLALLATSARAEIYHSWPIGLQREVDEGVYMSVVAIGDGWRVWRIETKSGVECDAVKPANGLTDPIPVGVGGGLTGPTPYLKIFTGWDGKIEYGWFTKNFDKIGLKVRRPGDRFWDEYDDEFADMSKYGESVVDVALSSWEYPALLIGYDEEHATFDLKGREWAVAQVAHCNQLHASIPPRR